LQGATRHNPSATALRLSYCLFLLIDKFVGSVVLVNVADILHRLTPNPFCCYDLHVVEPDVWIKSRLSGLFSQLCDLGRAGVIGGEGEKSLVQFIDLGIIEVAVAQETQVFGTGVDVALEVFNVGDTDILV